MDDGVYVIECVPTSYDTDYFLTVPATAEGEEIPALANGMALISRSSMAEEHEPTIHWLFMGLGDDGVQSIRIGSVQWDDIDSKWYSYDAGEFEFSSNKVNEITEENKLDEWLYPSVPAVYDYVSQMVKENKIKTITEPCHIAELEPGTYIVKNALVGDYQGNVTIANVKDGSTIDDNYVALRCGLLVVIENAKNKEDDGTETSIISFSAQGVIVMPNTSNESDMVAQFTIENAKNISGHLLQSYKMPGIPDGAPDNYEINKWYSGMPMFFESDIPANAIVGKITEESTDFQFPSAKAVYDYVQGVLPPSAEGVEY